jgi:hypothetical protein
MAGRFRIHETVTVGGRVMRRYVSMEARGLEPRFTSSAGER